MIVLEAVYVFIILIIVLPLLVIQLVLQGVLLVLNKILDFGIYRIDKFLQKHEK